MHAPPWELLSFTVSMREAIICAKINLTLCKLKILKSLKNRWELCCSHRSLNRDSFTRRLRLKAGILRTKPLSKSLETRSVQQMLEGRYNCLTGDCVLGPTPNFYK